MEKTNRYYEEEFKQDHIEYDENPNRHLLFHFAGPHSKEMKDWQYTKIRYFVPIKIK